LGVSSLLAFLLCGAQYILSCAVGCRFSVEINGHMSARFVLKEYAFDNDIVTLKLVAGIFMTCVASSAESLLSLHMHSKLP
jgi:hypothetical protein